MLCFTDNSPQFIPFTTFQPLLTTILNDSLQLIYIRGFLAVLLIYKITTSKIEINELVDNENNYLFNLVWFKDGNSAVYKHTG